MSVESTIRGASAVARVGTRRRRVAARGAAPQAAERNEAAEERSRLGRVRLCLGGLSDPEGIAKVGSRSPRRLEGPSRNVSRDSGRAGRYAALTM